MFIQIAEDEYINLTHVARVVRQTSESEGESYLFYNAEKNLLGQIQWGHELNKDVMRHLRNFGLAPSGPQPMQKIRVS